MDYQVDLDATHRVIRLTVTAETLTLELGEDMLRFLWLVAFRGGPYASIIDLCCGFDRSDDRLSAYG